MNVSVYNGAGQADYLYGLISGLSATPVNKIKILDIDLAKPLFNNFQNVTFYDVYRYQSKDSSIKKKMMNILRFYFLQARHLIISKKGIVHFQWLDRYYFADRILLPLIGRIFGHRLILTVHNVNARKRDNNDSLYNRLTLSIVYHLCNHLIVHTEKSKAELLRDFRVKPGKVAIIRHGMNNRVLSRGIQQSEAREELNIGQNKKVILFFGNIDYYKGLDILIESIKHLKHPLKKDVILLIAGNYKTGEYIDTIRKQINKLNTDSQIISHIQYIQDEDIEKYFMASDCIVLPYREIYQSGVLFMAYTFGLPALATKVGNFENDIINGKTGFLIDDISAESVANTIHSYFESSAYKSLPETRNQIKYWSNDQFSWQKIGEETYKLYQKIMN
jgi:D-inositol-3-phosphate glycosyltransferase